MDMHFVVDDVDDGSGNGDHVAIIMMMTMTMMMMVMPPQPLNNSEITTSNASPACPQTQTGPGQTCHSAQAQTHGTASGTWFWRRNSHKSQLAGKARTGITLVIIFFIIITETTATILLQNNTKSTTENTTTKSKD